MSSEKLNLIHHSEVYEGSKRPTPPTIGWMLFVASCLLFGGFLLSWDGNTSHSGFGNLFDRKHTSLQKVSGLFFGQVAGVAVSEDGSQFIVLCRQTNNFMNNDKANLIADDTIFIFSYVAGEYKFEKSFGSNSFLVPHGINIDHDNNIYVVDAGLDTFFKFDELNMVLKVNDTQPTEIAGLFRKPTDIAFYEGRLLVSDGYVNNHIVEFDKDGKLTMEFGKGEFQIPHNIDTDIFGNIFVADRENSRIMIFDSEHQFLEEIPSILKLDGLKLPRYDANLLYATHLSAVNYLFVTHKIEMLFSIEGEFLVVRRNIAHLDYELLDFVKLPSDSWPHDVATRRLGDVEEGNRIRIQVLVGCLDMQDALIYDFSFYV